MAVFPIAKLVGILVKQMGKPLANFAKERAKSNHFFRTYVCMPPAQFYHWCEVRMKMYVMNIGRTGENSTIPKLNEQAAIDLGASLLGEGIILSIAVGAMAWEYARQNRNANTKEKAEQDYLTDLEAKVTELVIANERLDAKMRELTRLVHYYDYAKINKIKSTKAILTSQTQSQSLSVIDQAIYDIQNKLFRGT